MPDWAQPAFEAFLNGLGVDERAVTEGFGEARAQVNIDLRPEEKEALTAAAEACGLRSAAPLARAIVRSWLVHSWNHPAELGEHDFGDGPSWMETIGAIKSEAEWPEGASEPASVFATLTGRLDRDDLLGVALGLVAQMSERDREALRGALSHELEPRKPKK